MGLEGPGPALGEVVLKPWLPFLALSQGRVDELAEGAAVWEEGAGWLAGGSGFLGPPRPEARPAFKRQSPVALRVLPFVACSKSFTSMNPPHSFLSCFPVYSCCIYFCHSSLKKQGLLAPLSRFTKQNEGQNLSVGKIWKSLEPPAPPPNHASSMAFFLRLCPAAGHPLAVGKGEADHFYPESSFSA